MARRARDPAPGPACVRRSGRCGRTGAGRRSRCSTGRGTRVRRAAVGGRPDDERPRAGRRRAAAGCRGRWAETPGARRTGDAERALAALAERGRRTGGTPTRSLRPAALSGSRRWTRRPTAPWARPDRRRRPGRRGGRGPRVRGAAAGGARGPARRRRRGRAHARLQRPDPRPPRLAVRPRRRAGPARRPWRAAADGAGQVVVLTGEAGIGKTTLLDELPAARGPRRADHAGGRPRRRGRHAVRCLAGARPWARRTGAPPVPAAVVAPGADPAVRGPRRPASGAPGWRRPSRLPSWNAFGCSRPCCGWSSGRPPIGRCSWRSTTRTGRPGEYAAPAHLGSAARRAAGRCSCWPVATGRPARDGRGRGRGRSVRRRVTGWPWGRSTPVAVAALAASLGLAGGGRGRRVVAAAEGNALLAVESARALAAGDTGPPPNLRAAVRVTAGRLSPPARHLLDLVAAAERPLTGPELAGWARSWPTRRSPRGSRAGCWSRGPTDGSASGTACSGRPRMSMWPNRCPFMRPGRGGRPGPRAPRWPGTGAGRAAGPGGDGWVEAAAYAQSVGALAEAADALTRATPVRARPWRPLAAARRGLRTAGAARGVGPGVGRGPDPTARRRAPRGVVPPRGPAAQRELRPTAVLGRLPGGAEARRAGVADKGDRLRFRIDVGLAWNEAVAGDPARALTALAELGDVLPRDADGRTGSTSSTSACRG